MDNIGAITPFSPTHTQALAALWNISVKEMLVIHLGICDSEILIHTLRDRPLIVQFAARHGTELADATEIVYRYSDGVDLNCGCPQRWAISEGYGACFLKKPDLVHDMIKQVRNRITDTKYTVSLKIRLHNDISRNGSFDYAINLLISSVVPLHSTGKFIFLGRIWEPILSSILVKRQSVQFCRQAEQAGVSWISIHGRTKSQRTEAVNQDAIKIIKENLTIPVVGNGDVYHLKDAISFQEFTGVNGKYFWSARGLLTLFSGTEITCVKDWINLSLSFGTTFHHHLMFMLAKVRPKSEKKLLNSYTSLASVLDHLNEYTL
ncbi:hypothetical protein TNIN_430911 [Trichonephila inaurata madagascariensis]|uniref:DUS-like FMN-binding domain-containing protein n=1 Tax=Trichonephila inaurata madagascariensis TaxID=2747483 RepID=A0A8X7BWD9_9ARAC|nr:hypothetical protein TNIN_430911 [Trichonephila inaurata madagascariensis]